MTGRSPRRRRRGLDGQRVPDLAAELDQIEDRHRRWMRLDLVLVVTFLVLLGVMVWVYISKGSLWVLTGAVLMAVAIVPLVVALRRSRNVLKNFERGTSCEPGTPPRRDQHRWN